MPDAEVRDCSSTRVHHPFGPHEGVLYIFLHGLIGVVDQPQGIELLIPNVGTHHSYRFGEFLGEVTLQPSSASYRITGIDGGSYRFDPAVHLVTSKFVPVCGQPNLYASIKLPLPDKIHSVLQVDLTDVIEDPCQHLAGTSRQRNIATMIPVLEYHFKDSRKLLFGGDPLNVAPIRFGHNSYVNLHIFAEEDIERVSDHTLAGFDAVAGLFEFDCAPRLISLGNIPPATPVGPLPAGTTSLELMSLGLRTLEMGYLGRFVREQILHEHEPVIVRVSPVGIDPITCTPMISRNA